MPILAFLAVLGTCNAADVSDVQSLAEKAFGKDLVSVKGERRVSAEVADLCKGYKFYEVRVKWHSKNPPTNILEERPLLAVSTNGAVSIRTYEDCLTFLSGLEQPVGSEVTALSRCIAFFELTNGTLRTRVPLKESIILMYKKQDSKDWDLVISGTDTGWTVKATASVNKDIDYCIRFEINVSREGLMGLVSHKAVYAYTLYE